MTDRPDALELLAEARRLLKEDLAPSLKGRDRFQVLMVANALGIASREIEEGGAAAARFQEALKALAIQSPDELARRLRAGGLGGDPGLFELLLEDAEARAGLVEGG